MVIKATVLMIWRKLSAMACGAADAEVVRLVEGNVAAAAQQTANFVLGSVLIAGIGLGADEVLVVGGIVLAIGVVRHLDRAIGAFRL